MRKREILKERVLKMLQSLDEGERIRAATLAGRTGIATKRELRQIVRELRKEGYLIGAGRDMNCGYYLIRTAAELEATTKTIKAAAFDQLRTVWGMERAFRERQFIIKPPDQSARKGEKS